MTYAEWDLRSNRVAHTLLAHELAAGDRVALLYDNADGLDYLTAYQGIHKAGCVVVPLNTRYRTAELDHVLSHCGAKVILTSVTRAESVADLASSKGVAVVTSDRWATAEDAVEATPRAPGDLADILYTSGTTGVPKGVACTHENIVFKGASQLHKMFGGATLLHAMPLFTFAGTHAMSIMCLRGGMTHLVMPRFDAGRYLTLLVEHGVRISYAVPAMLLQCVDHPRIQEGGFEGLNLLMYGTAPMPPRGIKALATHMPKTFLINLYGLTEGGAAVCSLPPFEALKRPLSIGKPMPPTELRVVDDAGQDVAPDVPGEIWMRTKTRRWYIDDEAATQSAWTEDGWLKTGDVGYLDADGYLYLVDRKKDLIICGGHNISAPEVEGVLMDHPAVLEAAIIGAPHPRMGEVPDAHVVRREGADVSADTLRAFVAERLADYKVPRTYTFVDALPRNALGKVLKRSLRPGGEEANV